MKIKVDISFDEKEIEIIFRKKIRRLLKNLINEETKNIYPDYQRELIREKVYKLQYENKDSDKNS